MGMAASTSGAIGGWHSSLSFSIGWGQGDETETATQQSLGGVNNKGVIQRGPYKHLRFQFLKAVAQCTCLACGRSHVQLLASPVKGSEVKGDVKDHSLG